MAAKPGVDATGEIEGDEIVRIDLEGLVKLAKPFLRAAVEVIDRARQAVDVGVQWIELLRAACCRDRNVVASWPCRPGEPDMRQAARRVERDAALEGVGRRLGSESAQKNNENPRARWASATWSLRASARFTASRARALAYSSRSNP